MAIEKELPEGWSYHKIKDVGQIVTGRTPPKNNSENYREGTTPFVKPPDLQINVQNLNCLWISKISFLFTINFKFE